MFSAIWGICFSLKANPNSMKTLAHPAPSQLGADSPIPVAASMLDSNLLNHAAHLHVFLDWCSVLQRTIKTRTADPGQLTHSLDA
jgi:hypothetical protein